MFINDRVTGGDGGGNEGGGLCAGKIGRESLYRALRERGLALKLLIFLSALLTGLTGALAGEQRIAASEQSVSRVLATATELIAERETASRPLTQTFAAPNGNEAGLPRASMAPPAGPRDLIPAKLQV